MHQLNIYCPIKFWTNLIPTLATMTFFSCFKGANGVKKPFLRPELDMSAENLPLLNFGLIGALQVIMEFF